MLSDRTFTYKIDGKPAVCVQAPARMSGSMFARLRDDAERAMTGAGYAKCDGCGDWGRKHTNVQRSSGRILCSPCRAAISTMPAGQ